MVLECGLQIRRGIRKAQWFNSTFHPLLALFFVVVCIFGAFLFSFVFGVFFFFSFLFVARFGGAKIQTKQAVARLDFSASHEYMSSFARKWASMRRCVAARGGAVFRVR